MMAQSKKRADKQPPQSDPLIVLQSDRFGLSTDTRFAIELGYTVCFLTSVYDGAPCRAGTTLLSLNP